MLDKPTSILGKPNWRKTSAAVRFLELLRPTGPWTVTAIYPDDMQRIGGDVGPAPTHTFTDSAALEKWIEARNGHANLYHTANGLKQPMDKKPSAADVQVFEFAHVDIDCDKGVEGVEGIEARKEIARTGLELHDPPPAFIVDTGGGLQALWRLSNPKRLRTSKGIERAKAVNRFLVRALGGDDKCINPSHLLRLPGTVNFPDARKRARGRVVAPARLVWESEAACPVEAFGPLPEPADAPAKGLIEPAAIDGLQEIVDEHHLSARLVEIIENGRLAEPKQDDDSRSAWLFDYCCQMVRRGVPREVIAAIALDAQYGISESVVERDDALRYISHTIVNAEKRVGSAADDFDDDFGRELAKASDEGQQIGGRIVPTPFVLRDPKSIPPRPYLMPPYYIRKQVTATLGNSAAGKTNHLMTDALALVTGEPLLGLQPRDKYRVWFWNGEDGREELERRLTAICIHYEITQADLDGLFFIDSGRELPIELVRLDPETRVAVPKDVDAIVETLLANEVDVLFIEPLVSAHSVPENLNEMMEKVAQAQNDIAERANVSIHNAHHAVKARGRPIGAMDYRGGGATLAKLRALRILNLISQEEAKEAGIPADQRWRYYRADDDSMNLAPPTSAVWFCKESVSLENADLERDGLYAEPDVIGVPVRWQFPEAVDLSPAGWEHRDAFLTMVAEGRTDPKHKGWPWCTSLNRPKEEQLHAAVMKQFGLSQGDALVVIKQFEMVDRICRETWLSPSKNRSEVWRVVPQEEPDEAA
jgi:hypothetical protein